MASYMSLGQFVFQLRTAPLKNLSRDTQWRYAEGGELGALPGQQFLGRNADNLTLKGQLRPEITGGASQLTKLRQMADTGDAQQLIDGSGNVWGSYVITGLNDDRDELWADGSARVINFNLSLKRVA